jgi:hypothetical protein
VGKWTDMKNGLGGMKTKKADKPKRKGNSLLAGHCRTHVYWTSRTKRKEKKRATNDSMNKKATSRASETARNEVETIKGSERIETSSLRDSEGVDIFILLTQASTWVFGKQVRMDDEEGKRVINR